MRLRKLAISLALILSFLLILCAAFEIWSKLARDELERKETAYLAQLGQVAPTYEAVTAYLNREFPAGLTKPEVVATLDARFVYRFVGGIDKDEPPQDLEWDPIPWRGV